MGITEGEKHESYGIIRFSRQQGGHYTLFGSSVKHNNTIELTICEGEHYDSFGEERYAAGHELVSIRMSPVQFAEAISTMNMGTGVPCTIEHLPGDKWNDKERRFRETCPEGTNARDRIQDYHKELMDELHNKLVKLKAELVEALDKPKLGKKDKEKILFDFDIFMQHHKTNETFVLEQFNRSVNKTLTQAKGELDAAVTNTIHILGLEKLQEMVGVGNNIVDVPLLAGPDSGLAEEK